MQHNMYEIPECIETSSACEKNKIQDQMRNVPYIHRSSMYRDVEYKYSKLCYYIHIMLLLWKILYHISLYTEIYWLKYCDSKQIIVVYSINP